MRIYNKDQCYASAPLVDIPLEYSTRDPPVLSLLDQNWNILLIKDIINFSYMQISNYELVFDGFGLMNDRKSGKSF